MSKEKEDSFPNRKVTFAPSTEVDVLRPYVAKVVRACAVAMGRDPKTFSPFVSDMSAVSDFCMGDTNEGRTEFFEVVSEELGILVESGSSMILEVAKRLMD
jgi:hypothetical protein